MTKASIDYISSKPLALSTLPEPDDMEVDEDPRSQAVVKKSSKTTRTKGLQGQDPQKAKGSGKEIQASTRRYRLTIDTESDDDSAAPQADVSSKPSGTNTATGEIHVMCQLNKPGTTPSQVRSIVRQLLDQQRYIFPYSPTPTPRAGTSADAVLDSTDLPSMAADETDNAIGANATKKGIKSFVLDLPFHAPAIVDVIHEAWWSGGKALGFKYIDKLGSNRADRPEELVLPDAMICLAGANIWAALRAWETGRYVEAKEFSQERLENTYTSLQAVLETQRNGLSAKNFNKTMHELYKKVTQSNSSEAALGSANSVICLPIDIDWFRSSNITSLVAPKCLHSMLDFNRIFPVLSYMDLKLQRRRK
ncbi:hypothetical protein MSAN_00275700 [Mycena sanguinolenta]|uniref:DUF6532 domain-containing protein n=1 Tax=Mycena sanguinolenta TaxID=230812 RepID=A0A8H6ZGC4_9AGAR|nr:hypothetical protein MSAN_00275700 [Mycena sanguinolenta]